MGWDEDRDLETGGALKIGSREMPWEGDTFIMPAAAEEKPSVKPDELALDRERRHAARRFFRAAPPYCVEFDADGTAMLCEKFYEYWPNLEPEEATTWRVISRHRDLEEAMRDRRLACRLWIIFEQFTAGLHSRATFGIALIMLNAPLQFFGRLVRVIPIPSHSGQIRVDALDMRAPICGRPPTYLTRLNQD
jgi:hypothetical protein